jgi:hypothetical protein
MSNDKISMLDDAMLEIIKLQKENAALKAIVAAKPAHNIPSMPCSSCGEPVEINGDVSLYCNSCYIRD